jgi:hypothetical protein
METSAFFRLENLLPSEGNRYRIPFGEWSKDSAISGMRGLSQDFPSIIKHLGDVVVHFLQVEQPAFVVCAEHALLVCEGLHPHCCLHLTASNPVPSH